MPIGGDIQEVLAEVGTPCHITLADGSVSNEWFDYEPYPDHSTTFVRQYCYAATFSFESLAVAGAIIGFDGYDTLVMNIKNERFEGDIVTKNAYLILCSTSTGKLFRKNRTRDPANYKITTAWSEVAQDPIRALHYASTSDREQTIKTDSGYIEIEHHTLYISAFVDIEKGDRWVPRLDGNFYEVTAITEDRYKGLYLVTIVTDNRE